jgi:hypothetical protein
MPAHAFRLASEQPQRDKPADNPHRDPGGAQSQPAFDEFRLPPATEVQQSHDVREGSAGPETMNDKR